MAAVHDSDRDGPTVLFRSELDALLAVEFSGVEHRPQAPGKPHMCGHDGRDPGGTWPPVRARAAGVVADPRLGEIQPAFAFSLHNLPRVPFGAVRLKAGTAGVKTAAIPGR